MENDPLPWFLVAFDPTSRRPRTPGVTWQLVPVSGVESAVQWVVERDITYIGITNTGEVFYPTSGKPVSDPAASTKSPSERMEIIDVTILIQYSHQWTVNIVDGYLVLITVDKYGQESRIPARYEKGTRPSGDTWELSDSVPSEDDCVNLCTSKHYFQIATRRVDANTVACWCGLTPCTSPTQLTPSEPGWIQCMDLNSLRTTYTFYLNRDGRLAATFTAVQLPNHYWRVMVLLPGFSDLALLQTAYPAQLPNSVPWYPASGQDGVDCAATCTQARFAYSALYTPADAAVECLCADMPEQGQLEMVPEALPTAPGRYQLMKNPQLEDSATYDPDAPTFEVVTMAPGFQRYTINGEPQRPRFIPSSSRAAVRFPSGEGTASARNCGSECWALRFPLGGADGDWCKCFETDDLTISDTYRADSGDISVVLLTKYLSSYDTIVSVPGLNYVRFFINREPLPSWFTSPGASLPADKWLQTSGQLSSVDQCLDACRPKHGRFIAVHFSSDGSQLTCSCSDDAATLAVLSREIPHLAGATQVLDATAAGAGPGAAHTFDILDHSGQLMMTLVGRAIWNDYMQYSVESGSEPATALVSSFSSSLPESLTWVKLSRQQDSTSETPLGCLGSCFQMRFRFAAVLGADCRCADSSASAPEMSPGSPPDQAGWWQVVQLPEYPTTGEQTNDGQFLVEAHRLSDTYFRLIANGEVQQPRCASPETLSSASGIRFSSGGSIDHCPLTCWQLHYPLCTARGATCQCLDGGATSLLSDECGDDVQTVYSLSKFLTPTEPGYWMTVTVPDTTYVRVLLGNDVPAPTGFTSDESELGTPHGHQASADACIQACLYQPLPFMQLRRQSDGSAECWCAARAGRVALSSQPVYSAEPGLIQVVDLRLLG